jgi:hypothetical protein
MEDVLLGCCLSRGRSLDISGVAAVLPAAIRFNDERFASGGAGGRFLLLYHP